MPYSSMTTSRMRTKCAAAGFERGDSPETRRTKLEPLFARFGVTDTVGETAIADLLGVPPEAGTPAPPSNSETPLAASICPTGLRCEAGSASPRGRWSSTNARDAAMDAAKALSGKPRTSRRVCKRWQSRTWSRSPTPRGGSRGGHSPNARSARFSCPDFQCR
jgi:hypothetical protein